MAKLELPAQDWTKELVSTSADKAAKAAGASAVKMLMVPVAAIRPIPGFNVRVESPDYLVHIDNLTQSILANGYYPNKPLGGYAGKEDGADVIFLTDGYSRLRAVEAAIDFGAEIPALPVVIKPQTDTLEDLTVALVQDNEGRPLSFYEKAIVAKRLLSYNMEKSMVAKRLNVTERGLDDYILVAGAPSKVRDMLIAGKVSASLAVIQLRKNPEKAADVLKAAVSNAEAAGKAKASAKHIGEADAKTTTKATSATAKTHQRKSVYRLVGGETVSRDQIKELLAVESGDTKWWSYVDESDKKKGILIDRTLTITLIVEDASLDGKGDDDSLEAAPAAAKAKPAAKPAAAKAKPAPAAAKAKPAAPSKPGDKKKIGTQAPEVAADELDNISLDDEPATDSDKPTIQTDDVFDPAAGDAEL